VSYVTPEPYFNAATASQQVVFDSATGTFSTGGPFYLTVDVPDSYFQIDFVCGPYINQLGPEGSNIFYTPQGRLFDADNGGTHAPVANASSLEGFVYLDSDNDGNKDSGESGIGGVTVRLYKVKTSDSTSTLLVTKTTRPNGSYIFSNLPVLSGYTYKIRESQPSTYNDGKDTIGTPGGTATNDTFSAIVLPGNFHGANNNFGERPKYLVASGNSEADAGVTRVLASGEMLLSIQDPEGRLDADKWARIRDAIATLNAGVAPYGVKLTEVGADVAGNIQLQIGATSPCGTASDGVLGCAAGSEITIVDGWNWYTGADAAAVGSAQYDFQTIVTHELGHGLWIMHSTDAQSAMYPVLDTGIARRVLGANDLASVGTHDDDEPEALRSADSIGTVTTHGPDGLSQFAMPAVIVATDKSAFAAADLGGLGVDAALSRASEHDRIGLLLDDELAGLFDDAVVSERIAELNAQDLDASQAPAALVDSAFLGVTDWDSEWNEAEEQSIATLLADRFADQLAG
jgi:hypothetical protein